MAAHRYWRLRIDRTDVGSLVTICEIGFKDSGGSAISGGTWTASGSDHGAVANALDGNTGTFWGTNDSGLASGTGNTWLRYDAGAGNTVEPYTLTLMSRSGFASQNPSHFRVQYSDDGSTWTDQAKFEKTAWDAGNETRSFNIVNGDRWRISFEPFARGVTTFSELQLRGSVGGADLTIPCPPESGEGGRCFGDAVNYNPRTAFDGNITQDPYVGNGGRGQWVEWCFDGPTTVAEIAISARLVYNDQAPATLIVLRSTDNGFNYTHVATISSGTFTSGQTKTFDLSAAAALLVASKVAMHSVEAPPGDALVVSKLTMHSIEVPPFDGPIYVEQMALEIVRDFDLVIVDTGRRRRYGSLPG